MSDEVKLATVIALGLILFTAVLCVWDVSTKYVAMTNGYERGTLQGSAYVEWVKIPQEEL